MKRNTIFIILISICLLTVVFFLFFGNKKTKNTNTTSEPVTQTETEEKTDNEISEPVSQLPEGIDKQTRNTINSQEDFIANLFPDDEDFDVESRLLDVFAPFGALDPLANESGSENIIKIQNISFGYFATKYGLSEERALSLVELPLKYANESFDFSDYFTQNKDVLNEIHSDVNSLSDINIIGYWSSEIGRTNNIFIDRKQNIMWELSDTEENYYDFAKNEIYNIETATTELTELKEFDYEALDKINTDMASINITTIYKCDGNTIYIMGATSNNAFGFIHGSTSAEEVNCGLLKNRFEIIKDEKLDTDWRFWIGR